MKFESKYFCIGGLSNSRNEGCGAAQPRKMFITVQVQTAKV